MTALQWTSIGWLLREEAVKRDSAQPRMAVFRSG